MRDISRHKFSEVFHSLRTQLVLGLMAISLVILSAGSFFSYIYIMDILKKNNEEYLLQQFNQADNNIHNVLSDVNRLTRLLSYNEDVRRFLQINSNTSKVEVVGVQNNILDIISSYISSYKYLNSIYIFKADKGGIGGSDRYTSIYSDDGGETGNFFKSGNSDIAYSSFPKAIIVGGITDDFYRNHSSGEKIPVISVIQAIKPYGPVNSGTIVFNLNERYVASIYTNSGNIKDGSTYILDETGKIISSDNNKSVGGNYQSFWKIDPDKAYGSFTNDNREIVMQGVYYKIEEAGLYLVKEIPLKYITQDIAVLRQVLIVVFIFSLIAIFIISFFMFKVVTRPLNIIAGKMRDVSRGNIGLTFAKIPRNEFAIVIRRFNEMSLGIVDLINKNNEIQEEKRRMEIEALQSQINPHFLYNTLNMIKWMAAAIEARNIVDSVVAIGNILTRLFKTNDPMCTLKEELEYLDNYIKIVNWRFFSSVSFKFEIEDRFLNCKIPRFIMQPIIENSITHGKEHSGSFIEINIDVVETESDIDIVISDNGIGIDYVKLKELNSYLESQDSKIPFNPGGSIGLINVNRRIRLNFGNSYGIRLESIADEGTRVIIKIPVNH